MEKPCDNPAEHIWNNVSQKKAPKSDCLSAPTETPNTHLVPPYSMRPTRPGLGLCITTPLSTEKVAVWQTSQ